MTSGRRATGLDSTVQTMLSVAASAGLRANQQPDYDRQLLNVEGELEHLERDYQARCAALMEECAAISSNRDMYESLQHLVAGLSDWYGSYTASVATSGTCSVSTAQSDQTDPAVTVSLELAVSSAASVSQSAEGSTATPAAVTHTLCPAVLQECLLLLYPLRTVRTLRVVFSSAWCSNMSRRQLCTCS